MDGDDARRGAEMEGAGAGDGMGVGEVVSFERFEVGREGEEGCDWAGLTLRRP